MHSNFGVLVLVVSFTIISCLYLLAEPKPTKPKFAVVTYLNSESYLPGVVVLAASVAKHIPDAEFVVFSHKPYADLNYKSNVRFLQVPLYVPSRPSTHNRFLELYTKLQAWNFTQYDMIMYLDADTMVVGDVDMRAIYELSLTWPFEHFFAACQDISNGKWLQTINAGVMLFRPSNKEYNRLMSAVEPALAANVYDPNMSEQAFLSWIYHTKMLVLPTIYNMNLAIWTQQRQLWIDLEPYARIVHYTMIKPFLIDNWEENEYAPVLRPWFEAKEKLATPAYSKV